VLDCTQYNTRSENEMKRILIRSTPLYPILRRLSSKTQQLLLRMSKPYQFSHNGIITKFQTNEMYSQRWFYPRYSGGKQHEPQATQKFVEAISHANTVVDVGANLGWFTCIAASQNTKCQVYGFELDGSNYQILHDNIELNQLTNAMVENVAVTNYDGELIYSKSDIGEASAVHRLGREEKVSCKANAIKLDTFFANKPQPEVIKIDVEGAEQLVLEGMTNILRGKTLKVILIEIHPKWLSELGGSVAEVCKLLRKAEFSLFSFEHRSQMESESSIDVSEIESTCVGGRMFIARKD